MFLFKILCVTFVVSCNPILRPGKIRWNKKNKFLQRFSRQTIAWTLYHLHTGTAKYSSVSFFSIYKSRKKTLSELTVVFVRKTCNLQAQVWIWNAELVFAMRSAKRRLFSGLANEVGTMGICQNQMKNGRKRISNYIFLSSSR